MRTVDVGAVMTEDVVEEDIERRDDNPPKVVRVYHHHRNLRHAKTQTNYWIRNRCIAKSHLQHYDNLLQKLPKNSLLFFKKIVGKNSNDFFVKNIVFLG